MSDDFTLFDYLEMVRANMPSDKTPGKIRTMQWLKSIKMQLEAKLEDLEQAERIERSGPQEPTS